MESVSFEMRPLVKNASVSDSLFEEDNALNMQDLPSHVARHSTTTMLRRKSVGNTMKRSGALKRVGSPTRSTAWSNRDEVDQGTSSINGFIPDDVLETVDLKSVPLPISLRRQYKNSLKARAPRSISKWKVFMLTVAMGWQRFRAGIKEWLYSLELWRGNLKNIEGQFGSGVVSYFVFLRWLMFLNLFVFLIEFGFVSLPTLIICSDTLSPTDANSTANFSTCKYEFPLTAANETEKTVPIKLLDFFTGQGWISNTIMFYSSYPSNVIISQEGVRYLLPLAYLLTGGAYFFFCLVLMIQSVSSGLKEGYIESEGVFNSFANRVFSAWDYCICERSAAFHKKQIIAQDIQSELQEEERLRRVRARTKKQKLQLYGMRILINCVIVPALWYVSFVVVITVILNQKDSLKEGKNKFEEMLIRSGLALAITIPNLLLPPLFEFLSFFEDWSPKFELALNLWRRIFVKLPSIAVLMGMLYKEINDDKTERSDWLATHCQQCWENEIAAQMYMLVWVDFLVVLLITIGLETTRKLLYKHCSCFRKIGLAQFDISRNVIDLAYGQCLILIGTFFSPILPVLGVVKLVVFFYAKKLSLFYNNRLPDKPFQGARLNSIFSLLLLFTFFMCAGLVGWGVTKVPTSYCGPFKNTHCVENKFIIDELSIIVSTWPKWLHESLRFMSTAPFVLPLMTFSFIVLFYYRSMAHAHRHVIDSLRDHLGSEGKYKKVLLQQLANPGKEHHCDGLEHPAQYDEEDFLLQPI